jgi:hypothetical protein
MTKKCETWKNALTCNFAHTIVLSSSSAIQRYQKELMALYFSKTSKGQFLRQSRIKAQRAGQGSYSGRGGRCSSVFEKFVGAVSKGLHSGNGM